MRISSSVSTLNDLSFFWWPSRSNCSNFFRRTFADIFYQFSGLATTPRARKDKITLVEINITGISVINIQTVFIWLICVELGSPRLQLLASHPTSQLAKCVQHCAQINEDLMRLTPLLSAGFQRLHPPPHSRGPVGFICLNPDKSVLSTLRDVGLFLPSNLRMTGRSFCSTGNLQ